MILKDVTVIYKKLSLMQEEFRAEHSNVKAWMCRRFMAMLEAEPKIEAEPVRHGKWIPVDGESPCDEWDCSACRERMTFMYEMDEDDMKENFPRCPKCAAKMDGKEGETE